MFCALAGWGAVLRWLSYLPVIKDYKRFCTKDLVVRQVRGMQQMWYRAGECSETEGAQWGRQQCSTQAAFP